MKVRLISFVRTGVLVLAALLVLPILAACSASSDSNGKVDQGSVGAPSFVDGGSEVLVPERPGAVNPDDSGSPTGEILKDRKLTYTYDLRMETRKYQELTSLIVGEVTMAGGYIQQSSLTGGETPSSLRQAVYVLRIPSDKVEAFLEQIKLDGNVLSQSSSIEDITLQYVDTETRLASLRIEQETLMGLLERAETIEDIITIQDRLTYLRYEIESYEAQKRSMDNMVDYSVVNVSVREVQDFTPAEEAGFWAEAGRRFTQAWRDLGTGIRTLALGLVSIWPLLLLGLLVLLASLTAVGVGKKKRRKKLQSSKDANPSDDKPLPPQG